MRGMGLAAVVVLAATAAGAQTPRVKVTTRRPGEKPAPVAKPAPPAPAAAKVAAGTRAPRRVPRVKPRRASAPSATPGWRFLSTNVEGVTWSVARRAADAEGDRRSGDLILRAEPEAARVYFYLSGGAQLAETTRAVVKGRRVPGEGRQYVLAVAPELGGRAGAFVPLRAGHITTVRFRFQGEPPAPAE